ncbi:FAD-binding and (Fe-S)-binding domain-containing protein [Microlunatus ginsengisoli]|uniref:FAD-binding and (Fe-S)-binding domain-containing protein n=1 Tax=Microlunatus ginsengisoli TaxID=363863 RepID=A0ABP6ZF01_9ACTN
MTSTDAQVVQLSPSWSQALRAAVDGEVRFDDGSRAVYAVDSSNYRQPPLAVVAPSSVDDAVAAVAVCARYGVPVVSRGGGTSLAGQTTNAAVVIDWTKYCHRLVSVDVEARTCVVEPGIALDDLNRQLADHDLMYGPKPATHRTCTIGGMIGNNSCGSTAQAYGKTVDNLVRLEILTYDGLRMWVGPTSDQEYAEIVAAGGRRAEIYATLRELRDRHLALIRTRYPTIPRRVSGYNLDSLLPENHFDLACALVGSEGTLVTVLQAELTLVEVPKAKSMVVLGYHDIAAAGDAVPAILPHEPWQLEGLDQVLVQLEKQAGLAHGATKELPRGGGWLMIQFAGADTDEADAKAQGLIEALEGTEHEPQVKFYDDPAKEDELVEVREAGLGATAHPIGQHDNWPGWEDSAVPPERLGDYLRDLRELLTEFGYAEDETSLYGHFGQGCIHCRIPFELRTADGIAHFRAYIERAADLVVSYGGSLSGEHGDGRARGELLPKMFGADVVALFGTVKTLFDPDDRMNPGKVVAPQPLDGQLRLGPAYSHAEPSTYFSYPEDKGRFSTAVLRCVGIGTCRNSVSDEQVMCPSYMVTREEEHSTRGRARLLFEMLRGDVITDGWRSTEVRDALDLCLACKGCKTDCPVNVDMATYKAEFLAHHYRGRLRPRAHYSMGWLPALTRPASLLAPLVNLITGIGPVATGLKRLGGIAPERDLPVFAGQTFASWWRSHRPPPVQATRGPVLLWPDTFTNHFHPGIAQAAVRVLTHAGFEVRVPTRPVCCGLTWVSTGQLGIARRVLGRTLRVLRDEIRAGTPVVGLEPSCTAMFRADGPELLGGDEDMRRLSKQTVTLAELLRQRAPDWQPPQLNVNALVQTHCHQHAIMGNGPDAELLAAAGVHGTDLKAGCCGLAGNFGFEQGHYEVSRAAGERVLLPRLRAADQRSVILADGFSCRTQIEQGDTTRRAVHLAELLAAGLDRTEIGRYPEHAISRRPRRPFGTRRGTSTTTTKGTPPS